MKRYLMVIFALSSLLFGFCTQETQPEKEVTKTVKRKTGDQLETIPRYWIETNFAFPGGKWKALVMSYDDAPPEDRQLVELFNKYGVRGTFHINSGFLDNLIDWDGVLCEYLSSNEIVELYEGHEISSHGVTHANYRSCTPEEAYDEFIVCVQELEEITGFPVRGLSYPFGTYNNDIIDVIYTNGIEYARTTAGLKTFHIPKKFLIWDFTCHQTEATNLMNIFLDKPDGQMALFAVWGHSWELSGTTKNDNWEYMESFLSNIGGRDDIWYATMIEVVDYVNAVMTVEFLDDGSVTNPSAMEVWVKRDDTAVLIPAGGVWP